MLDHDVAPVVRSARRAADVNHFARRDRMDRVERFTARVAAHRPDVHALMEARVNRAARGLDRIAHETVLAAFPRVRNHAVEVALDHLVEIGVMPAEQRVVVRRRARLRDVSSARADAFMREEKPARLRCASGGSSFLVAAEQLPILRHQADVLLGQPGGEIGRFLMAD